MFNAHKRGLRERSTIMEDITYFLVGKLEGRSVKSILATYPCHQPGESLAFRTSLAKYVEGLRHKCIFAKGDAAEPAAWWWRDVVVRKSLLEEFERLILALTTHTLMRLSRALDPALMSELLRAQPLAYSASLMRYRSARHAWAKSASLLTRRQLDFKELRDHLGVQSKTKSTKYDIVPTPRLKDLVDSTLGELLRNRWTGADGKRALEFAIELAGLRLASSLPSLSLASKEHDINAEKSTIITSSPLPVAAAHHPTHLKRLRRSVLQPRESGGASTVAPPAFLSHAKIIIADRLEVEKSMHQTLVDAITKLQHSVCKTTAAIKALINVNIEPIPAASPLWMLSREYTTPLNLVPQVGRQFMASLELDAEFSCLGPDSENDDALEKKIEDLRRSVLPPYPVVPDLAAMRLPPRDFKQSTTAHAQNQSGTVAARIAAVPQASASTLPVPPAMSPGKSSRSVRRKSVRFSMARQRTGRPSMFRVFSGQLDDEVDRLVDETHDFPTDDENEGEHRSPVKTPRGKPRPRVHRIWTAGTPASSKRDFRLPRDAGIPAPMRLPSLALSVSAGSLHPDSEDEQDERETLWAVRDVNATPRASRYGELRDSSVDKKGGGLGEVPQDDRCEFDDDQDIFPEAVQIRACEAGADIEDDEYHDEAPSLTLKEILLSADASHLDLLEFNEDMEEGALGTDASFVWE
ncbi:hypothetical protein HYPSUDRAFT_208948 [Hypholoma sublateritium FD-334 SS-4]|uniref:HAUS augmin-like complex subunit 6 N-terminal domain-containing protein n=1 Tax=Hypholoma sublateritium (strain FD-334 SS-4) TaxID=945553 RepID=A0A0D2LTL1_HYPSF|nr:hypothetical protein HYPSUDRAFT_208948 [Hypholoma sublateritium FD-334 SS-4]